MAVLVVALVFWASQAEVERIVRVEGRVIPAGRNQIVQHLEGGIVAAIKVQEGDTVAKGDTLLIIDATTAESSLGETKIKLAGQRMRALRLSAEAEGLADLVAVPHDAEFAPLLETERRTFLSRKTKKEQERQVITEQLRQRTADLREVEARRTRLSAELETARKRLDLIHGMASRGAASSLEVLEAESRKQRLETEIGEAEGAAPKLRAAVAESEARIEEIETRARSEAQSELSGVLLEIDRLSQALAAQTDRFSRTDIRAPVAGIVNRITVNTVGGVVKPGDALVELTPIADQLLFETRARPSDRGELRPALPSNVRLGAYDAAEFGTLSGRVVEVSADTVQDGKGDPYYRVVVAVEALPASYHDKQIVPGMPITADIVIGRRTILKYITSPLAKFTYNAFRDAR